MDGKNNDNPDSTVKKTKFAILTLDIVFKNSCINKKHQNNIGKNHKWPTPVRISAKPLKLKGLVLSIKYEYNIPQKMVGKYSLCNLLFSVLRNVIFLL